LFTDITLQTRNVSTRPSAKTHIVTSKANVRTKIGIAASGLQICWNSAETLGLQLKGIEVAENELKSRMSQMRFDTENLLNPIISELFW